MKEFHESERYNYDLTPASIVFDCGGYEGNFAKTIAGKYRCKVHVFEPVHEFYHKCVKALEHVPGVVVHHVGVGASTRIEKMRVSGDSTGAYSQNGKVEEVSIQPIRILMNQLGVGAIDLLKLNIEGLEGETIEAMLDDGTIKRVRDLQVQPHVCMPDAARRWPIIQKRLAETHELTYCAPWCWENWRVKSK